MQRHWDESVVDVNLSIRFRHLVSSHVEQTSSFGILVLRLFRISKRGSIRLNRASCRIGLMHTCHDIPIGGCMRLSRDGGVDNIVFVTFFVFKDHLMVVDNYYRVAVSPLFVIRCAKYCLLG